MLALVAVSLHNNIFLPKTMVMVAWAPSLLIGTVVGRGLATSDRSSAGVAVAAIALVMLPYVCTALSLDEGAGPMISRWPRSAAG